MRVEPSGNIDMTWYTGSPLSPSERAEHLLAAFPTDGVSTLAALVVNSGLIEDEILRLVPMMIRRGQLRPLDATSVAQLHDPAVREQLALRTTAAAETDAAALPVQVLAYMARGVKSDSWVATDPRSEIREFFAGYQYAATQTMAIKALSQVSPEDLYYLWKALERGVGKYRTEQQNGSTSA